MAATPIIVLLSVLSLISVVQGGFKFGGLTIQQVNTQLGSLLLPQINQLRASAHPAPDAPLEALTWNATLATAAGQWASKCILNDNSDEYYAGKVGESTTIISIRDFVKNLVSADQGVSIWASQNATYDYTSDACFQGTACADYRQLVWDNTKQIGCATNICNKQAVLVCQYYPPGDAPGVRPFTSSAFDNTALQVDLSTGDFDKVQVNETGEAAQDGSTKRSLVTSKRAVVRGTNNYGDACTPVTTRPTGECTTMDICQNSGGRYAYWGSNICGGGDSVLCCIRSTPYTPSGSPTSAPTSAPPAPTSAPPAPTSAPPSPTSAPPSPTSAPPSPTAAPTKAPTAAPTKAPTSAPSPTSAPASGRLSLPSGSLNWRGTQAVTPVKNQGSCGSCWTFASSGAAESAWAIATGGVQLNLAEQRLVDCVTQSNGCNGGNAESALPYIVANGGTLEATLPYTAADATCPANVPFDAPAKWIAYKPQSDRSVAGIQKALQTYGPMVVYVYADNAWQSYSGGVLSGTYTDINHAVLLVGYDPTENAWIIKNSWGTSWGDKGFIHIDVNNNFGMTQWGPYAITA